MINLESTAAIPLPTALRTGLGPHDAVVGGRRVGRVLFGAVLIGAAVVVVVSFLSMSRYTAADRGFAPQFLFAGAWLFALVASTVGRVVGAAWVRQRGRPIGDAGLFVSLAVPAVGISLLAPLSLHALVALFTTSPREFDEYARMASACVGHAHLVLAGLMVQCCWRLANGDTHMSALKILFITTGVSCVPGILAMAIPPVVVLVTGALFIPAMVVLLERTADSERQKTWIRE